MFEEHLGVITDFFKYEQTLSASFKIQIEPFSPPEKWLGGKTTIGAL